MDREVSPRLVVFVLWLTVFSVGTQALIVAPILPRIGEQLGAPAALLGTLVTAYAVSVGAFALVTGPVSDRVGRRRILLAGTVLLTVALALHGLATDFETLLAVRAFAGVAGGILNGAAVAYVGDYFPADRRGWANGWVFSGFAAGQIAGIPLGTVLADAAGFRAAFLAFAVIVGLSTLLVYRWLPTPAVSLSTDSLSVGSAVRGYASLLRRPDVAAATSVFVVMFLGNALYTTYLPTWLETSVGLSAAAVGGMFLVGGVANVVAGPRAGTFSDRVGRKRVIVGASVGLAALMLLTPVLVGGVVAAYVVFFGVMALFASRATPFQTMLTELVEGDRRGSLMSLTVGVGQVGSGVGGALAGAAYGTVGYGGTAAVAAGAMLVVIWLVWRYLPETGTPGEAFDDVFGRGSPSRGPERLRVEKPEFACPEGVCGPMCEAGATAGAGDD